MQKDMSEDAFGGSRAFLESFFPQSHLTMRGKI